MTWELRKCAQCGRENIRPHRPIRAGELRCPCGSQQFRLYDPIWVPRHTHNPPLATLRKHEAQ